MGNPALHLVDQPHADLDIVPDPKRGILSRLTADAWAAGMDHLPKPGPDQAAQPRRDVVLRNVPRFEVVRITFELSSHKHRRTRLWSWRAVRAEPMLVRLPVRAARWYDDEVWR